MNFTGLWQDWLLKKRERGPEPTGGKRGPFAVLAMTAVVLYPVSVPTYTSNKGLYVEVPYVHQVGNY